MAATMPPLALKWYERASASLRKLDVENAEVAIANSVKVAPANPAIKLLAAQIALSQLRFDEAIQALEGLSSRSAQLLMARALWQSGQLERVTPLIERLMVERQPSEVWLQSIAELTRSGSGREPFRLTGAKLAVLEMLQVPQPTLVIPVELNGEEVLAMIATGSSEVVLNAKQGQPAWISLRFGQKLEVKDVPAFSADLSSLTKRVGAPIRLLLGVDLLRRLNVTFDFHASQFIARSEAPAAPPGVGRIAVSYLMDGRMAMRSQLQEDPNAEFAALLIDTQQLVTLSMGNSGWQKAGLDPKTFEPVAGQSELRQARIPRFGLGTFDIPGVPGVFGLPRAQAGKAIEIDGTMGSTLLAEFRVSMADGGRTLWLEAMPQAAVAAP